MQQNKNTTNSSTHYGSFWPIAIVFIVGVLVGGGILYAINSSDMQYDLDSVQFSNHFGLPQFHKKFVNMKSATSTANSMATPKSALVSGSAK